MKYFTYTVFFFLMTAGCKPGIPKNILQPDEMALVLHDIHIFDGYVTTVTNVDTARKVAAEYYNSIYKKFNTDSATYTKSLDYYVKHPRQMTEIYTKVTNQLKKEKDALVKADSLQNVKSAKAAKLKLKADSIKKSDSLKIAIEQKKLRRQLDSLAKSRLLTPQLKKRAKKAETLKKRQDSLKRLNQQKKIKKTIS